eukprot:scaffold28049_cov26-Tisochrysis_lutea.AAC.1
MCSSTATIMRQAHTNCPTDTATLRTAHAPLSAESSADVAVFTSRTRPSRSAAVRSPDASRGSGAGRGAAAAAVAGGGGGGG